MFTNLRRKIALFIMRREVKKLEMERESFKSISDRYQESIGEMVDERARVEKEVRGNVVGLVREQMKGFDPKLLDDENDLPEVLGDIEAQEPFLAGMKRLQEDKNLWALVDYLKRNQIMFSMSEALTLDQINFARATINGWALLREEVDRLATVYTERHAVEPKFDEHEVV